jgi:predicted DNA-binding transcriptional regulator AlpA
MEAIKNGLLGSTAAFTKPVAKAKTDKGKSKVEAEIERKNQGNKPEAAAQKPRDARADSAPYEHHHRHGDRGDDADANGGEDDGPAPHQLRGRKLLTRHLCARYRVSDRTIDRWMRDPHLGFPQPIIVNRRRYWDESDIAAFDAKQKGAAS